MFGRIPGRKIGVILGVVFLREVVTWQLIAGALMIVVSIVIVNVNFKKRKTADG